MQYEKIFYENKYESMWQRENGEKRKKAKLNGIYGACFTEIMVGCVLKLFHLNGTNSVSFQKNICEFKMWF